MFSISRLITLTNSQNTAEMYSFMKNVCFYVLSLSLRGNVLFSISNIQHKTDPSLMKAKILSQKLFCSAAVCLGLLWKVETVVPADPPIRDDEGSEEEDDHVADLDYVHPPTTWTLQARVVLARLPRGGGPRPAPQAKRSTWRYCFIDHHESAA